MNRLATLFTFTAAVVLLGACASGPAGHDPVLKAVAADCNRLYEGSRLDPVRESIQLPISFEAPQPIEMLANRSRATEAQKPAIKAISEAILECRRLTEVRMGPSPLYRLRSEDRVLEALADLYDGATTYGQFARDLLYIGERDKIARETLDEELRTREKFRALHDNGN